MVIQLNPLISSVQTAKLREEVRTGKVKATTYISHSVGTPDDPM
jgi:hypothetical protein